jgi:hypothetical protein
MTAIAVIITLFVCIIFGRNARRAAIQNRHYQDYLAGKEMDPRD